MEQGQECSIHSQSFGKELGGLWPAIQSFSSGLALSFLMELNQ